MRVDLVQLLTEHGYVTSHQLQHATFDKCKLSIKQIRDRLHLIGNILHEDLENQVYVASLKTGLLNMNRAVVALQLTGNRISISGFAAEGVFNQHSVSKAFQKIEQLLCVDSKKTPTPKSSKFIKTLIIWLSCVVLCVSLFMVKILQIRNATATYNDAVESFNHLVVQYNELSAKTCISNIDGLPQALEPLSVESTSFSSCIQVVFGSNSRSKIKSDTETILNMAKEIEIATTILAQITAPEEDWIINRLGSVAGITGTQAVTEDLDPDNLLGKDGSYSSCVYFTFSRINPEDIPGDTIVDKGTDAGGAIEVYRTLEDAEARCDYLAGFDGTVLYSGSYAIVGTIVIRTSYLLTNEEQFELTSAITRAFTTATN